MDAPTLLIPERTPAGNLISATPFPRPAPGEFLAEFLPDDRLADLVESLIEHHDAFASLADLTIRTLWQKDAGKEDGRLKLGSISQQTAMTRYLTNVDYVIVVGMKAAAHYDLTNWQMEALLFHQLMHIEAEAGDDGEIRLRKRPHDIGLFNAEIINYGAWYLDLANTSNAFTQQPLWKGLTGGNLPSAIAPERALSPNMLDAARDFRDSVQTMANEDGVTTTLSAGNRSVSIGPTRRTVDGETFELDDAGRYVNRETGEYLEPTQVPRASAMGR